MGHRRLPSFFAWIMTGIALVCGCATHHVSIPVMPPFISPPHPAIIWQESFDAPDLTQWREVSVHDKTHYHIVELDGRRCLKAESHAGASILLHAVDIDPEDHPWISWEWRVDRLVEGEALERKDGSDAAARVYVYFETKGLPWQKKNLDYLWSAVLPVGTMMSSAYRSDSKILVVESGSQSLGQWRSVERNLMDDYARLFGDDDPPDIVAIGLMTDADNTQGEALAYFDELRVSRSPGGH